jgi:outer membrane protein TolC
MDGNKLNIALSVILGKPLNKFLIILIYLNVFLIVSANSQPDSLISYLEIAAKNNPSVLQKFYEYKAALQKIPQAGSLSDPELSLGVFLKPMELVSGNQVADIRLMQMFPWFGVLKSAKDEMSQMANAKFELFRDAKLQVLYEVQRKWYELYRIRKEIIVSEKNIEILKVIERLSLVRLRAAPSSSSSSQLADIYSIQIETGELENNISLLNEQRVTLVAQFNFYLKRPVSSPVFTYDNIAIDSLELSLSSVSDSMIAKNPMLQMLNYEKQSLEAREKMVSGMRYPMVGLGLNYSLINKNEMSASSMNGSDMIMPMVTVTLPLYRRKYNAMRNEAEFMKIAASQNFQATLNSLQSDYYEAAALYNDARRRVKLYASQYQLSSKTFDLMLKSFGTSTSSLTDVLRVHRQTLDYELKQVIAIADLNTSVAWLRRLGNISTNFNIAK